MDKKTISKSALDVIDQYLNFGIGSATCRVPYFNNKTTKNRASLRTYIGKGSPDDIRDEIETIVVKEKIDKKNLTGQSLKKLLVDKNLGIECSGFSYHVLNAESQDRRSGPLSKNIRFTNCDGLVSKMRCFFRPVENCDVETFANEANSVAIPLRDAMPGDMIIMTSDSQSDERNHILVIHEIDYRDSKPAIIHYSHSIAYPEDGVYGTGARTGTIEIENPDLPITQARWIEEGKQGDGNPLFIKANKSQTQIRRLRWF